MLANRGQEIFVEASLEEVLESLVAHRRIDLGSEWHLHRHRYEHSAWEIYLAKTRTFRHQVVMSEGHEENEGSVNECDAHSCKTKAE